MLSDLIWLTLAVVVLCWTKFSNPAPVPAPAGFEFTNPARSGSGRIWKSEIRYISTMFYWLECLSQSLRDDIKADLPPFSSKV